jgi:hypothetical protein
MQPTFASRRHRSVVAVTILAILAAFLLPLAAAGPAVAAAPSKAPEPRYSVSGTRVVVKGLSVPGATRYQVAKSSQNGPARVVATISGRSSGQFTIAKKGGTVVRARALNAKGQAGPWSIWTALAPTGADDWSVDYVITPTRSSVGAYVAANSKYTGEQLKRCGKSSAFMSGYKQLQKQAARTKTIYGVATAGVMDYYKRLYTSAFTTDCAELGKVATFAAKVVETVVAKRKPVVLGVTSYWNRVSFRPDFCTVHYRATGGPSGLNFSKLFIGRAGCAGATQRWH